LAHSVRVAFGMTPIVSNPSSVAPKSPTRNGFGPLSANAISSGFNHPTSLPHSTTSTPMAFASLPMSMPGSRAGSPPIKLPPLKIDLDRERIKIEDRSNEREAFLGLEKRKEEPMDRERVELPGFSQFAAAARSTARF